MSWTFTTALLVARLAAPTVSIDPALVSVPVEDLASAEWQVALRVSAPATTTDPQHVGVSLGVGRSGAYRVALRYTPSETTALGFVHGTLGLRLLESERWTVAADVEHSRVWSARRLFRTGGFQFEGHDRRWLTLGVVSARASHRRWFGLIDGFEVGGGRMVIRDMVAGRVGSTALNEEPVLVLKTAAPVGMLGLTMSRPLFWGLRGGARVRVIGAGHSRGGVVPFAHAVVDWEVTRTIFRSGRHGHGTFGVAGNHASSNRAATYYRNGLGLTLKIAF